VPAGGAGAVGGKSNVMDTTSNELAQANPLIRDTSLILQGKEALEQREAAIRATARGDGNDWASRNVGPLTVGALVGICVAAGVALAVVAGVLIKKAGGGAAAALSANKTGAAAAKGTPAAAGAASSRAGGGVGAIGAGLPLSAVLEDLEGGVVHGSGSRVSSGSGAVTHRAAGGSQSGARRGGGARRG